jgi:hypothetical protein
MLKNFFGREAGKVFSAKNLTEIRTAYKSLRVALVNAGIDPDAEDDPPADKPKKESAAITASEAAGFAVADLATLLTQALNADAPADSDGYRSYRRVIDIFDTRVIYQEGWIGPYWSADYSVTDDGQVSFAMPVLVIRKVDYIAPGSAASLNASEAGDLALAGDIIPLTEAAVSEDGRARAKLIAPGWGSSGYYPADVLRRDGPQVFKAGTKMFLDHPTAAEESARPEGSITNLAAVLLEDARFENGNDGPGLYAPIEVRSAFREDINELAPHIGVSIRASGKARIGDAEGRRGPIVEAITAARSVDFVTTAGAGGRIVELFEAARQRHTGGEDLREAGGVPAGDHSIGATEMPLSEQDNAAIATMIKEAIGAALAPLAQQTTQIREAAELRDARGLVDRELARYARLPRTTRERIAPELATSYTRTDAGTIDAEKLREAVRARVAAEYTALAEAGAPGFAALVEGFGDSRPAAGADGDGGDKGGDDETFFAETFAGWGMTEAAAKIAARGR